MKKLIIVLSVCLFFVGKLSFSNDFDIIYYKNLNYEKIKLQLESMRNKSIWALKNLNDTTQLGTKNDIEIFDLLQDSIRLYTSTTYFWGNSIWAGSIASYLNDAYSNASIYLEDEISAKNSYPINIKFRIIPKDNPDHIQKAKLTYHSRNSQIIPLHFIKQGKLPFSITINIVIDDFIDECEKPYESENLITKNLLTYIKKIITENYATLEHAMAIREEFNNEIKSNLLERISSEELPVSKIMPSIYSQDPITQLMNRWTISNAENASKNYALAIIFYYLSQKHFQEEESVNYLLWPKEEDFSEFTKLFELSYTESPEEEKAYFDNTYKQIETRYKEFKEQFTHLNFADVIRNDSLYKFIPALGGASSPARMLVFNECFDKEKETLMEAENCYKNINIDFSEIIEKKNSFIKELQLMWYHISKFWDVLLDMTFITEEEYVSRKVPLQKDEGFYDNKYYNQLTRSFIDKNIFLKNNELLLQFENTDNIDEIQLDNALKKLLSNYDGWLFSLADLYFIRDSEFRSSTLRKESKKVLTLRNEIKELEVTYLETDNDEIQLKQDRDLLWGMLYARAMLPQSLKQTQGSCASNAFFNVISSFKKKYPGVIQWSESEILEKLHDFGWNEWSDLRDGMYNGRDINFYNTILKEASNYRLNWTYSNAITPLEIRKWIEKKLNKGLAIYFGTKISYSAFPALDFIHGGGHALTIVGRHHIPKFDITPYIFISDSNNKFYSIPEQTVINYIEANINLDYGYGSGDPSFTRHRNAGANTTLKAIEFIQDPADYIQP